MLPRSLAVGLAIASFLCAACGGAPRSPTADLAAIRQPTPDPTLDAVVRDLPRALAGVIAPPTPTPTATSAPPPKPKPMAPPATVRPAPRATAAPATVSKPRP